MRERALSQVAAATGGELAGPDARVRRVAVDSRRAGPGSLFVALPGTHRDGHDFLADAFGRGAAGALVQRAGHGPSVVVADTGRALLDLAADERSGFGGHVVGITGSNGKTSVKDLTAAILAVRFPTHASERSFNTEVGLPLTLLEAPPTTEAIICEMGSRGAGHVALLCEVARPSVGIVTNVGPAHLETFGSLEGVAEAKAELVAALPEGGTAVLNADDVVVRGFAERTRARVVTFGVSADADVRGEDLRLDPEARPSFTLRAGAAAEHVELPVPGEHMAWNALAAAACGIALGVTPAECASALKAATVSPWRMETFETPGGVRVVNDAYNANPASMAAALKAARWMAREGACIAVLGEMAELGEAADPEHERIGELLARLRIDRLVTVGTGARRIAAGAEREGVEPHRLTHAATPEDAAAAVRRAARAGDVVLIKASRRAGLERVAELLAGGEA